MKRICLLNVALLCLPLLAVAQQRNISDAMLLKVDSLSCFIVNRAATTEEHTAKGFVLMPADGHGPDILAYSDEAFFPTTELPERISTWIKGYTQMQDTDAESLKAWMEASKTAYGDVAPLLGKRQWGQDNPYNLYCPTIDGKHSPSGCVATALAQIMCNHQWPLTGTGSIDYVTSTNKISISYDFSTTSFEWDRMQDVYSPVEETETENMTIARDGKYYLESISIDENSIAGAKCYVKVKNLMVMGTSVFEGETVLVLTDEDGNFVSSSSTIASVESRSSGKLFTSKSFLLYIPSSLPEGTYHVYSAVRASGAEKWSLANARGGNDSYLALVKSSDSFSIADGNYPCSPSSNDVTPIAKLLQAVGAAVKMDYGYSSSGSNDANVLNGMVNYLGYDQDMFFAEPEDYTDSQWHEMLQRELSEGRPVYYTGQGQESGHAFVIDGFEKRADATYYHVNWGWDGLCNGYYLLNMLRPSSTGTGGSSGSNYSNRPSMLIGLKPDDGVTAMTMTCKGIAVTMNQLFPMQFMPMRISRLTIQSNASFSGTLQMVLSPISSTEGGTVIYSTPITISPSRGLTDYNISCLLPDNVDAGDYELSVECIDNNGQRIEITYDALPRITVKSPTAWNGGEATQPLQALAVGSTMQLTKGYNEGALTVRLDSVVNPLATKATGELAIAVCDTHGRMLAPPTESVSVSVGGYSVRSAEVATVLSRHMPDGDYTLRIAFLPEDESLWTFCDQIRCKDNVWWAAFTPFYIFFTVNNGMITIPGSNGFQGADIPWETGIDQLRYSEPENCYSVYDLQGRKLPSSSIGIPVVASRSRRFPASEQEQPIRRVYLIRKGNKTTKIIK